MPRYVFIAVMLTASLTSAPSFAASSKGKMETCKFGADDQKLEGAARTAFMKKCMANRNDPRGPATGAPTTPAAAPKQ
jgi:PleD family two-component response regulator